MKAWNGFLDTGSWNGARLREVSVSWFDSIVGSFIYIHYYLIYLFLLFKKISIVLPPYWVLGFTTKFENTIAQLENAIKSLQNKSLMNEIEKGELLKVNL